MDFTRFWTWKVFHKGTVKQLFPFLSPHEKHHIWQLSLFSMNLFVNYQPFKPPPSITSSFDQIRPLPKKNVAWRASFEFIFLLWVERKKVGEQEFVLSFFGGRSGLGK